MASWVEKYKPRRIEDILSQNNVKLALRNIVSTGGNNMPHLLLFGPTGCGKTLSIKLLVHELFGESKDESVFYVRSTDELGIATVRTKIKYFSQRTACKGSQANSNVQIKLIIIEDADYMTPTAQAALRRIIETQSTITRFCLTCSQINRIIDPIVSRCVVFRLKHIPRPLVSNFLQDICIKEQANQNQIQHIANVSHGDIRKAISMLEIQHVTGINDEYEEIQRHANWFLQHIQTCELQDINYQVKHIITNSLSLIDILNTFLQGILNMNLDSGTVENIYDMAAKTNVYVNKDNQNTMYFVELMYYCRHILAKSTQTADSKLPI